MKRILDEDDLIQIKKDIQEKIDENKFNENYATSDTQGGAAISTKVGEATTGDFRILLTDNHIDGHGGKQIYQDTDLTYDADAKKIDINVTHADTANHFSEAKKIELSGDVTGSALSTGEFGWNINTFLKEIIEETTAGPNNTLSGYTIDIPYIEIDKKGRVKSLINKEFIVPQPTLENFGDGTKHYGWKGTPKNTGIENNDEGEVFNSQLSWGGTIKIPNFLVDEKGRVQSGWTSKYTLPAAPETPEVPVVNGIEITGAVEGTGEESNGNWTINTKLVPNQWVETVDRLESNTYTTTQDVSSNILIAFYWNAVYNTEEEDGTSVQSTLPSGGVIVPVKLLMNRSFLSYPVTYDESVGIGIGYLSVSYNSSTKKATFTASYAPTLLYNIKVYGLL
ncbi:MAG: hypothetical protein ACI311_04560 [Bacilli bacterium]